MSKKLLSLTLAFLMLLSLSVSALATEYNFYVSDETGVLSQDTVDTVTETNAYLEEMCDAQIVIVFVEYFGNTYADEYAVSRFNELEVSGNGMLLAACPNEKRGGITVGSDIDSRFTTDDINSYLDRYFWEEFDKGNYDTAVTKLVAQLKGWYEDEFNFSDGNVQNEKHYGFIAVLAAIINFIMRNITTAIFLVIFIILVINDTRKFRRHYLGLGVPVPRYRIRYLFNGPHHRINPFAPPSPGSRRPPSGGTRPPAGGARRPSSFSRSSAPRNSGMGGRSSGSFGGRSGSAGRSSRGFSSRSGSSRGGGMGGRSGGGFGGRR